jgi:hypothetical protein
MDSPSVFGGVCVTHLCSFLCYVFFVFVLCLVYTMLPVSLVFSNVYSPCRYKGGSQMYIWESKGNGCMMLPSTDDPIVVIVTSYCTISCRHAFFCSRCVALTNYETQLVLITNCVNGTCPIPQKIIWVYFL